MTQCLFGEHLLTLYLSPETLQEAAALVEDLDLEIQSVTYIKPQEDESID